MKNQSLLLVCGVFLLVSGCGHSNNNQNFDDLTTGIQGTFNSVQQVNAQGNPPYDSCPTPANQIDSRLQTGMVFQTSYQAINGNSPKRILTVSAQIQSVSTGTLLESVSPLNSVGLSPAALSNNATLTCNATGDNVGCTEPSFVNLMQPYATGQYAGCLLDADPGQATSPNIYSGKYTLADGKVISAYKTELDLTGKITCDNQGIGSGTQTSITIVSLDVPAENAISSCNGTTILSFMAFKNRNSKVIVGNFQERTAIP